MKPNGSEVHSENNGKSVLEQVRDERERQLLMFETMEKDDSSFNLALVTMPDDFIIDLYKYLVKKERRLGFLADEEQDSPELARAKEMITKLEDLEVIQKLLVQEAEEAKKIIADSVAIITEKQKVRRMGPIRRFVYNINNKKK